MSLPPAYREFAADLAQLAQDEDRAALATLRRGLGKSLGEAAESYRILPRWFASGNPTREDARFLVATLFALHPLSWDKGAEDLQPTNLGVSFRRLMDQTGRESVEARFVALLNSHVDDLPAHLRHGVSLLRSAKTPISVDWAQLLHDVDFWANESRSVQRAWARAYWGSAPGDGGGDQTLGGNQPGAENPTPENAAS